MFCASASLRTTQDGSKGLGSYVLESFTVVAGTFWPYSTPIPDFQNSHQFQRLNLYFTKYLTLAVPLPYFQSSSLILVIAVSPAESSTRTPMANSILTILRSYIIKFASLNRYTRHKLRVYM